MDGAVQQTWERRRPAGQIISLPEMIESSAKPVLRRES
jgi:hypothetical protein